MTTEELKRKRIIYNKRYVDGQKRQGVIIRSFQLPKAIVEQVKQFIKEQSALLNATTKEKG